MLRHKSQAAILTNPRSLQTTRSRSCGMSQKEKLALGAVVAAAVGGFIYSKRLGLEIPDNSKEILDKPKEIPGMSKGISDKSKEIPDKQEDEEDNDEYG